VDLPFSEGVLLGASEEQEPMPLLLKTLQVLFAGWLALPVPAHFL